MSRFTANTMRLAVASAMVIGFVSSSVYAADPPAATSAATQNDPAMFDRDGKRICGYELMSDSERAGHRSQLHATKALEDRDNIRAELCKSMEKRAKERGVELKK